MAETTTTTPVTPTPQQAFDWIAVAMRFVRGFLGVVITLVIASGATAFAGLGAVPINFSDPKNTAKALMIAFILGFLSALFKAIRDQYGNPNGAGVINKLPL